MGGRMEVVARFPDGAVKISNFSKSLHDGHDLIHITENSAWLLEDTAFLVGGRLRIGWLSTIASAGVNVHFLVHPSFSKDHLLTLPPIDNPDDRRGGIHRHAHGQALLRKILTPSRSST